MKRTTTINETIKAILANGTVAGKTASPTDTPEETNMPTRNLTFSRTSRSRRVSNSCFSEFQNTFSVSSCHLRVRKIRSPTRKVTVASRIPKSTMGDEETLVVLFRISGPI